MKGLMSGTAGLVGVLAGTLWVASGALAEDTTVGTDVKGQIEAVKSILSGVEMKLGRIAKSIEQADKDTDQLLAKIRAGADPKEVATELRRLIAVLDAVESGTKAAVVALTDARVILDRLKSDPTVVDSESLSLQVEMLFDSLATIEKAAEKADEDSAAVRSKLRNIVTIGRS